MLEIWEKRVYLAVKTILCVYDIGLQYYRWLKGAAWKVNGPIGRIVADGISDISDGNDIQILNYGLIFNKTEMLMWQRVRTWQDRTHASETDI